MRLMSRVPGIAVVAAVALLPPAVAAAAPPVTNNHDTGAGSLRAAIAGASAGDTITIPNGIGQITLTSAPLAISQSLTINGAGQPDTTISGGGTHQIFAITGASSNVTLSNLTLTSGAGATQGSAINTAGPLTLTDVTIGNCSSNGFGNVYSTGSSLSITGSTFANNTTFFASDASNRGAVVDFEPTVSTNGQTASLQIDHSTFTNNTAGGNASWPGHGGAISFAPSSVGHAASNTTDALTVTNSTFTGNKAGNGGVGSSGGAIDFVPGDDTTGTGNAFNLTLSSDTFTSQQVQTGTGGGATATGGAVAITPTIKGSHDTNTTTITGTTFTGNSDGGDSTPQALGGALALEPGVFGANATVSLAISGGSFHGNTLHASSAFTYGGAIAAGGFPETGNANTTLAVNGTTFSGNEDGTSASAIGRGGAIYFEPVVTAADTATLRVTGSDFDSNGAGSNDAGSGGAIVADAYSGVLPAVGSQMIDLEADTFHGNVAGGSVGLGSGGAVYASGQVANSQETISGDTFDGNSASAGNDPGTGGAVTIDGTEIVTGAVTLANDTFTANHAGGATATTASHGGAIDAVAATHGSITVQNDSITGNMALGTGSAGGGIAGPASLAYENTVITGNTAPSGADCGTATASSGGGNVEGATSCGFTGTGDLQNTDPKLAALADNGGGLETLLPMPGSPVLGIGIAGNCPSTDERGLPRLAGAACDTGAVQIQRGIATTGSASGIGATSATLAGTATAGEAATTADLEYGTTTTYGHATPAQPVSANSQPDPVTADITGLTPGTLYHYRLVVTTAYGSVNGADGTFKTRSGPNSTTPSRPKNTKKPRISGKAKVGKTLKCSRGSWSGHPSKFAYQWKRSGKKIKGATKAKHKVKRKDAGKKLTCTVTASNAAGKGKPAPSKPVRVKR
jgi:fibronectin-binding autotransporter adhesin